MKHLKNKSPGLPFVFSNFALTADGKIAFANGEFVPFGSKHDRENMMVLRAKADAVMAAARTISASGAIMGSGGKKFQRLRLARDLSEYHLRVIVTGSGSMDLNAEIFKHRFSPIIMLVSEQVSAKRLRELRSVADEVKVIGEKNVNFRAALRWLRDQWKVKRLLCEGGGELHGTMVRAGLVNELHLTICPMIFGGRTAPTFANAGNRVKLSDAAGFKFKSAKRIEDELFAVFTKAKTGRF